MSNMISIDPRAVAAIRAAKNRGVWGRWATMRYLARRGVSVRLYQIAVACEATVNGDFVEAGEGCPE